MGGINFYLYDYLLTECQVCMGKHYPENKLLTYTDDQPSSPEVSIPENFHCIWIQKASTCPPNPQPNLLSEICWNGTMHHGNSGRFIKSRVDSCTNKFFLITGKLLKICRSSTHDFTDNIVKHSDFQISNLQLGLDSVEKDNLFRRHALLLYNFFFHEQR